MKIIRLVVFNEPYWDKGLIYSQNILPLLQLVKTKEYTLDVISFTSLPFLLKSKKRIHETIITFFEFSSRAIFLNVLREHLISIAFISPQFVK